MERSTVERWKRIEQIFHGALRRNATARESYVSEACHGDGELFREVASLLANHGDDGDFDRGLHRPRRNWSSSRPCSNQATVWAHIGSMRAWRPAVWARSIGRRTRGSIEKSRSKSRQRGSANVGSNAGGHRRNTMMTPRQATDETNRIARDNQRDQRHNPAHTDDPKIAPRTTGAPVG